MNHSGGKSRGDSSENYYHFVWDDEDIESIDHVLSPSKARERVAKILKETELPDEELTVFTIPQTPRRIDVFQSSDNRKSELGVNTFRINNGPPADQNSSALLNHHGTGTGNFDSLENLDSMHDFTENGYVEISGRKPGDWRATDLCDSWSFDDSDDRGLADGACDSGRSLTKFREKRGKGQDKELQSVRFRKFQSDIGHIEDNYIDDDEFEPEPEGSSTSLDQPRFEDPPRFDHQGKPIARAILPMDMEMEMESEDDDSMLDTDRGQEFELRSDCSDTQPIVMRVDQAELSQEFKKRRRKIKIAVVVGVTCVICGAVGAIIYLVVHFLQ